MQHIEVSIKSNRPDKATEFHARLDGRVIEVSSKCSFSFRKRFEEFLKQLRSSKCLENILNVFERLMYKQIVIFINKFFSKSQCGFRKEYNIKKWKCLIK